MLVLVLAFGVAFVDQLTKYLIWRNMLVGEARTVIPGLFSLRFVQNTGAAWGMFAGFSSWLVFLSVLMLVLILVFRKAFLADTVIHRIALGLMIAGIVGNLMDRIRFGYVVDFLDFYLGQHHFPAFNVADSAICVGVGLYLYSRQARNASHGGTRTS
ncbi:MAG: signal peptidase II [Kiritimatiellia bacterium]